MAQLSVLGGLPIRGWARGERCITEEDGTILEVQLLCGALWVLLLEIVEVVDVLTTNEADLGLARTNGEVRELRKVVLQDYGLDQVARDFLGAVGLVEEKDHGLVLVVLLQAVVEGTDVEDAALAFTLWLSVLADYDEGR